MAENAQETNWKQLALYFIIVLLILAIGIFVVWQISTNSRFLPFPTHQTTGLTR
jgi:hypothetical protein